MLRAMSLACRGCREDVPCRCRSSLQHHFFFCIVCAFGSRAQQPCIFVIDVDSQQKRLIVETWGTPLCTGACLEVAQLSFMPTMPSILNSKFSIPSESLRARTLFINLRCGTFSKMFWESKDWISTALLNNMELDGRTQQTGETWRMTPKPMLGIME